MAERESKEKAEKINAIKEALIRTGAISQPPPEHAAFRFVLGDGVVTVYNSGSVVYGGKGEGKKALKNAVDSVLTEFADKTPRIGCDEAGKGEFAGPLVVACVYCDGDAVESLVKLGVKDSKKLSNDRVFELAEKIKKIARGAVKVLMPYEYNRLYSKYRNLNRLLDSVYLSLIERLVKKYRPEKVIVDKYGNRIEGQLRRILPDSVKIEVVEKAEEDPVVAAASIVARAERLKGCKILEEKFGVSIPSGNSREDVSRFLKSVPENVLTYLVKTHFNVKA
ncbi:ribonuclease HIII [Desulfurobacterium sp.]